MDDLDSPPVAHHSPVSRHSARMTVTKKPLLNSLNILQYGKLCTGVWYRDWNFLDLRQCNLIATTNPNISTTTRRAPSAVDIARLPQEHISNYSESYFTYMRVCFRAYLYRDLYATRLQWMPPLPLGCDADVDRFLVDGPHGIPSRRSPSPHRERPKS